MRKLCGLVALGVGMLITAHGEGTNLTCPELPKTKLELFAARTGVLLIKASSDVGTLAAKGGTILVRAKEYTEASTGKREYGLTVELKENDQREEILTVDAEELEALLSAIDYVSSINPTITTLPAFQAVYVTRGELQVATYFSRRTGTMEAGVRSNRNPAIGAHLSMSQLAQFRTLVDAGKRMVDELRAGHP